MLCRSQFKNRLFRLRSSNVVLIMSAGVVEPANIVRFDERGDFKKKEKTTVIYFGLNDILKSEYLFYPLRFNSDDL